MSATIEANLFANYLKIPVRNEMQPAPILTVEGGTFKVAEYFIEDLEQLGEVRLIKYHDGLLLWLY